MKHTHLLLSFSLFIACLPALGQGSKTISGTITDSGKGNGLAFATVSLKNSATGTVTNENGQFDFLIPNGTKNDTLVISYLGYITQVISLANASNPLTVKLERNAVPLKEVVVRPMSPQEYIKLAINNIKNNYPGTPFQTIGYYRELAIENKGFIRDEEAVFKSYYPSYNDTTENQHQLILHRKGQTQPLKFMKDKIDKSMKKSNKEAIEKGEEEVNDPNGFIDNLGGPDAILSTDFVNSRELFMDSTEFKNYKFSFGASSSFLGKDLLVINFQSRRVNDYQWQTGKIFMEPTTYAIVSVEYTAEFELPALVGPALFLAGIGVEEPSMVKKYNYYEMNGKWYPQNFQAEISAVLIRKHLFKANEISHFNISEMFLVSKIITDNVAPIEKKKRFNTDKKFEVQVVNDDNLKWTDVNTVKRVAK